ncbi:transcriptional regulator [Novosphingobium sediminicola]|uniref:DNA-binding XRE family transcriptional regulator n=1 Tax=Novosphingobium sediminicola TaxID=563162 RepID=A0A7W6CQ23_9SPHN|nr:transcriptional regulator [Novosphingobium sediminicola]MBB3957081.1 DNA-binding XRE family transcriptional regulator [Novosphingobium sediminicola]
MVLRMSYRSDGDIFSEIKSLSGRLIERRRRRDSVTQRHLAQAVERSERWLREIEGGSPHSMIEDHVRCAHSLGMTTPHLFIPILASEHKMMIPRELLMQDDLWDLEHELLEVVERFNAAVMARQTRRSGHPDGLL